MFFVGPDLLPQGSMKTYVVGGNAASQSVPEFISSLIPSNIMDPFVQSNSTQLLILAVIIGIAVGVLRAKQNFIGKMIEALNSIFIEVLNFIFVFSPYALFFAVLGISLGGEAYELGFIAAIFVTIVLGLLVLVLLRFVVVMAHGISPL